MKMKRIYLIAAVAPLAVACTDLRDLYDTGNSVLHVEGSWSHSLGEDNMQNATVLLHHDEGARDKKHLSRPNGVTVDVMHGDYDVMVFNGVMVSEDNTNLDHVLFRGTNNLSTFEAYVAEATPIRRLSRADDEYIASNGMEVFTFAHHRVSVDEYGAHYVKYRNGERTDGTDGPHVAGTIESAPRAMSFRFQVRLTNIVNPVSAISAAGSFRGFLGSVFMPASGDKPRPGFRATHHLQLSTPVANRIRTRADGEQVGTLVSPWFVTFGPPLPEGEGALPTSGQYFFEPVFVLLDGSQYTPGPIDVTEQVNETIERMMEHHGDGDDIAHHENVFEVAIENQVTLPVVAGGGDGPQVDVKPWEDDEIIIVWI